jgi:hypothetical protein
MASVLPKCLIYYVVPRQNRMVCPQTVLHAGRSCFMGSDMQNQLSHDRANFLIFRQERVCGIPLPKSFGRL